MVMVAAKCTARNYDLIILGGGPPRSPLSPHTSPSDSAVFTVEGAMGASIEQLCDNVCDMQSSDRSPSTSGPSFLSKREESRIDSEVRHIIGDFGVFQDMEEGAEERTEDGGRINSNGGGSSPKVENNVSKRRSSKSSLKSKVLNWRPPSGKKNEKISIDERIKPGIKVTEKGLEAIRRGNPSTVAGIAAQIGAIYYMMGSNAESYESLEGAISLFYAIREKRTGPYWIFLNQMGLACIQLYEVKEEAELFEEARDVFEMEHGPYHPDMPGVYSHLGGAYDALGRLDDVIRILEYIVDMREEKLGTANPDVDDERHRLAVLLKEAGKVRTRKSRPLEAFLENSANS